MRLREIKTAERTRTPAKLCPSVAKLWWERSESLPADFRVSNRCFLIASVAVGLGFFLFFSFFSPLERLQSDEFTEKKRRRCAR